MTGEDLGYKSVLVEQAKFEYSPLGKIFNKGLDEKGKKEGLLKRFKSIENKSEKQLRFIENKEQKQLSIKSVINIFDETYLKKQKICLYANQEKSFNYKRLNFKRDKSMEFDFRDYKSLKKLFKEIYYWKLSIDRIEDIAKEICWYTNYIRKMQTNKTWIYRWKIKAFR